MVRMSRTRIAGILLLLSLLQTSIVWVLFRPVSKPLVKMFSRSSFAVHLAGAHGIYDLAQAIEYRPLLQGNIDLSLASALILLLLFQLLASGGIVAMASGRNDGFLASCARHFLPFLLYYILATLVVGVPVFLLAAGASAAWKYWWTAPGSDWVLHARWIPIACAAILTLPAARVLSDAARTWRARYPWSPLLWSFRHGFRSALRRMPILLPLFIGYIVAGWLATRPLATLPVVPQLIRWSLVLLYYRLLARAIPDQR